MPNPDDIVEQALDLARREHDLERQVSPPEEPPALDDERAALAERFNLDPALARRIEGDSPAAREADAETLAKLAKPRPVVDPIAVAIGRKAAKNLERIRALGLDRTEEE